jgi:hypothetical protein
MDSISLGYYFDDGDFDSIILQRKELCPDGRWISESNAAISRALVEGECTSPEFGEVNVVADIDVNVVADIDPADCPTPMDGEWLMHRNASNIPMFEFEGTDDIMTFSYSMTDTSGYVWYVSSAKDDLGGPSLEIGFKYEDAANGTRDISMKFRGRTEWKINNVSSYQNYWSSAGSLGIDQVGSFASPVAIIIATIAVGTCFSMESADLGKICGGDHFCATRLEAATNKQIGTFILQRYDLCNGDHWEGVGGTLGYLDPADCP